MKKNGHFIIILVFINLIFVSIQSNAFEFQTTIDNIDQYDPNLNFYDYINDTSISISYYHNNELYLVEMYNNSKISVTLDLPDEYKNQGIKLISSLHLNEFDYLFLIIIPEVIVNDSFQSVLLRFTNGNNVFASKFLVDIDADLDLFKFKNEIHYFYTFENKIQIVKFNPIDNSVIFIYEKLIQFYTLNDLAVTSNYIYLTLKEVSESTKKCNVIVLENNSTNLIIISSIELKTSIFSVAPLNNDNYIAIHNKSFVEIDIKTDTIKILAEFDDENIYSSNYQKLRAFSNQEIVLQTDSIIFTFLIVSNSSWIVWELSYNSVENIQINDFDINQGKSELILFGTFKGYDRSGIFIIINPGIQDPKEKLNSLDLYYLIISESYEYEFGYEYQSNDNTFFIIIFLIGIVSIVSFAYIKTNYDIILTKKIKTRLNHDTKIKTPTGNKVICNKCRNKMDEGSIYCSNCGHNNLE